MASPASPALPPASTGFVTVSSQPDIRLFYSVTPALPLDPARPVLVLSNSLAATTALWDAFAAAFAPTHTVVRYDARFHGRSPLSATPGFDYAAGHTIDDLADDVVALLDALRIRRAAAFVGLSIGGGVGVSLAARYPDRFASFVIVGTRSQSSPGDAERMAARADVYRAQGARAQAEQSVARWFGAAWIAAHPAAAREVAAIVAQTPVEGFVASAAALTAMDLRAQAEQIRQNSQEEASAARVLFVVGAADAPAVVDESRQLAAAAGSRLEIVADSGHIVNVQQPARFHAIVRAWLGEGDRGHSVV